MSETRAASSSPGILRPNLPLGIVVAMACLAQFMVVLDSTIVTVALPQMRAGLGLTTSEQQWVVSGYLITLGGFLMLSARVGDLIGRRRVFVIGGVIFTAASLAGGLAGDPATLLAARIVQGVGAAALAPTSLSLITVTHADEKARQRALSLWAIAGGAASSVGVVLGGALTTELDWRWVLFVNIPLGGVLLVAAFLSLLPDTASIERTRLDLPGAFSITLGMGALSYGLSQASSNGWGSTGVLAGLVAAGVLLVGFVVIEANSSRPLIPLALFRPRTLQVGNLLMLTMGVTMTGAVFFLSLYFQEVIGYSALRAGMAMLPMTVMLILGGLLSRSLIPVVGRRVLLLAGGLISAVGIFWLVGAPDHAAFLAHVLGPTVVAGLGVSFMLPPVTLTATIGIDPKDAGAAAGLLNTSRQIGGAIGLAVLVNIASTATAHALHTNPLNPLAAIVHGYHVAFVVDAALMVVAALAALALPPMPAAKAQAGEQPSQQRASAQS